MDTVVNVRVVPNASRAGVVGWMEGSLKVKVQAPAEGGRANRELVMVLARACGVGRREIEIVSGETSRQKRVKITGVDASFLEREF